MRHRTDRLTLAVIAIGMILIALLGFTAGPEDQLVSVAVCSMPADDPITPGHKIVRAWASGKVEVWLPIRGERIWGELQESRPQRK